MDKNILMTVSDIERRLEKIFKRHRSAWLQGEGTWPLQINFAIPLEKTILNNLPNTQRWIQTWQKWKGVGELKWTTRHWNKLGKQNFPSALLLFSADNVAMWLGEEKNWHRAYTRFQQISQQFSSLKNIMVNHYTLLVNYTDDDWQRLLKVLLWFYHNPNSNLYLRQLPIVGIDTKWIETRKAFLKQCLTALFNKNAEGNFYRLAGLKAEPTLIRLRLLDDALRKQLSHLDFIGINRFELMHLNLPIENIFIVENIRTGLAFHDILHSVVIMGLGYGVECLANIPWVEKANCYYWGDIDTHGFAILNRLRHYIKHMKSILMEEEILLAHKELWSKEEKPTITESLSKLTPLESTLYKALCNDKWGSKVRLEQERINWKIAWNKVKTVI